MLLSRIGQGRPSAKTNSAFPIRLIIPGTVAIADGAPVQLESRKTNRCSYIYTAAGTLFDQIAS